MKRVGESRQSGWRKEEEEKGGREETWSKG